MERITTTEVKANQEEWEHKYGQGIVETMSGDFAELERRALAHIDELKAGTPDPLEEIMQEQLDMGNTVTGRDRTRIKNSVFVKRYGSSVPLTTEVTDELVRDSEESTSRTTHT